MAKPPIKVDQHTLLLLLAQWMLFVGNFAVYFSNPLPLWVHILIGVLAIHFSFTIWHEAAHGTVCNRRWLNNLAGVLGMFPYTTPFFMQRHVHLDHHKYLNVPGHDPNQIYADGPLWQLPLRYVRAIGYARRLLNEDPRTGWMRLSDNASTLAVILIFGLGLYRGVFLDLVLIWLVPLVIAKLLMDWYVNYLPHTGLPADRFLGTRIIDVRWLTPLLLAHNYHAIHHLWPTLPWHRYIERYHARHDYLVDNGVPIETRLIGGRLYPQLATAAAGDDEPPRA
jgi:beta-carotene hydroxylase